MSRKMYFCSIYSLIFFRNSTVIRHYETTGWPHNLREKTYLPYFPERKYTFLTDHMQVKNSLFYTILVNRYFIFLQNFFFLNTLNLGKMVISH